MPVRVILHPDVESQSWARLTACTSWSRRSTTDLTVFCYNMCSHCPPYKIRIGAAATRPSTCQYRIQRDSFRIPRIITSTRSKIGARESSYLVKLNCFKHIAPAYSWRSVLRGTRLQPGLGFENLQIKGIDLQTRECICLPKLSLLFLTR